MDFKKYPKAYFTFNVINNEADKTFFVSVSLKKSTI